MAIFPGRRAPSMPLETIGENLSIPVARVSSSSLTCWTAYASNSYTTRIVNFWVPCSRRVSMLARAQAWHPTCWC